MTSMINNHPAMELTQTFPQCTRLLIVHDRWESMSCGKKKAICRYRLSKELESINVGINDPEVVKPVAEEMAEPPDQS